MTFLLTFAHPGGTTLRIVVHIPPSSRVHTAHREAHYPHREAHYPHREAHYPHREAHYHTLRYVRCLINTLRYVRCLINTLRYTGLIHHLGIPGSYTT